MAVPCVWQRLKARRLRFLRPRATAAIAAHSFHAVGAAGPRIPFMAGPNASAGRRLGPSRIGPFYAPLILAGVILAQPRTPHAVSSQDEGASFHEASGIPNRPRS